MTTMSTTGTPLLEARGIQKHFGQVVALAAANFELAPDEVHAIVGDNGAGKSTLIKIISGVYHADGGELLLEGKPITIASPREARALGIETVYQDLALADHLDAAASLFLGREEYLPGRDLHVEPVEPDDGAEALRRTAHCEHRRHPCLIARARRTRFST